MQALLVSTRKSTEIIDAHKTGGVQCETKNWSFLVWFQEVKWIDCVRSEQGVDWNLIEWDSWQMAGGAWGGEE